MVLLSYASLVGEIFSIIVEEYINTDGEDVLEDT
jgi:hypothetical protein